MYSRTTPHTPPSRANYGVSFVRSSKKNDRGISTYYMYLWPGTIRSHIISNKYEKKWWTTDIHGRLKVRKFQNTTYIEYMYICIYICIHWRRYVDCVTNWLTDCIVYLFLISHSYLSCSEGKRDEWGFSNTHPKRFQTISSPFCRRYFKTYFLNWNLSHFYKKNPLKFVLKGPVNNKPALVQIMSPIKRQAVIWINNGAAWWRHQMDTFSELLASDAERFFWSAPE